MTMSKFLDDNFYLVAVTKKMVIVTIVKVTKMIISTDMVVICIGTKRDC